ncbi:MAG: acetamidase/formamidase family protein [Actinomycetota bacterium]
MAEHHLDGSVTQPFWDRSVEPRLTIASGDTVTFDCPEPCGQVEPTWTSDDLANLDFSKVHAVIGSVYVEGAQPGDTLQVDVLDMRHRGWGWSAHIPHFGLLADDFDFPYLHHWEIADDVCRFGVGGIEVPFAPFCGVLGVAPEEEGRLDTIPPRRNGGNIDVRDIGLGASAYLPVLVEGALFGCGDCHGAQGDGEVSGTAVEAPMEVTLRLTVRKDVSVRELEFSTPGRRRDESRGYHVTTAHGPDLLEDSRNAVRAMIGWLGRERGLTPSQAYVLCSTAVDLRISEVVDAPNWIVSAYLPLSVFPAGR